MEQMGYFEAGSGPEVIFSLRRLEGLDFYAICLLQLGSRPQESLVFFRADTLGGMLQKESDVQPTVRSLPANGMKGSYFFVEGRFLGPRLQEQLHAFPFFDGPDFYSLALDLEQSLRIEALFKRVIRERGSDYVFKPELLKTYFLELIHWGLKLSSLA